MKLAAPSWLLPLLLMGQAAWAQEPVPPLQPPLPLAPPPMPRLFAPMIIGDSFEARIVGEDMVAALSVRGLSRFPLESSWSNQPYACLKDDRTNFSCVQAELKARQEEEERPPGVVLLYGSLNGGQMTWVCAGADRVMNVEIDLGVFFSTDINARNGQRNAALACMEAAAGYDQWQISHTLL